MYQLENKHDFIDKAIYLGSRLLNLHPKSFKHA